MLPIYRTEEDAPATRSYQTITASLRAFAGRVVRIRFAEVDNQFFFLVGIDRVELGKKAKQLRTIRAPKPSGRATATAIPFAPEPGPLANVLVLGDDEVSLPQPIGFAFDFFGTTHTEFVVSSNGLVGFAPDLPSGCCLGGVIPSDDGINGIIALAWTDLYPPGGGTIAYELRGSAPNRRLVLSYDGLPWFLEFGVNRVTTQLILYERKSVIEVHTTHQEPGRAYTQGVENADGTVAAFLEGRVSADYGLQNDGVRFTTAGH